MIPKTSCCADEQQNRRPLTASHVEEKVEESKTCPALGRGRHAADATTRLNKYRRRSFSWMNGCLSSVIEGQAYHHTAAGGARQWRHGRRRGGIDTAQHPPFSLSLSLYLGVCFFLSFTDLALSTYGHLSSTLTLSIHHPSIRNIFYLSLFLFRSLFPDCLPMILCRYNLFCVFVSVFTINSFSTSPLSLSFPPSWLCYSLSSFSTGRLLLANICFLPDF